MGTWGIGNFEDDHALHYLESVIDELASKIQDNFSPEQGSSIDISAINSIIMPPIDVLVSMCSSYNVSHDIAPETISRWGTIILNRYDQTIDDYGPKEEYKVERRRVIEDTFSKFIKLSYLYENQ